MSKRYHEIMENIQLTTETREQILRHVSERERKVKVQTMKKWTKYLSVAACCALVVGAAYGIDVYKRQVRNRPSYVCPINWWWK